MKKNLWRTESGDQIETEFTAFSKYLSSLFFWAQSFRHCEDVFLPHPSSSSSSHAVSPILEAFFTEKLKVLKKFWKETFDSFQQQDFFILHVTSGLPNTSLHGVCGFSYEIYQMWVKCLLAHVHLTLREETNCGHCHPVVKFLLHLM